MRLEQQLVEWCDPSRCDEYKAPCRLSWELWSAITTKHNPQLSAMPKGEITFPSLTFPCLRDKTYIQGLCSGLFPWLGLQHEGDKWWKPYVDVCSGLRTSAGGMGDRRYITPVIYSEGWAVKTNMTLRTWPCQSPEPCSPWQALRQKPNAPDMSAGIIPWPWLIPSHRFWRRIQCGIWWQSIS